MLGWNIMMIIHGEYLTHSDDETDFAIEAPSECDIAALTVQAAARARLRQGPK